MKIVTIIGARPQFIKAAMISRAIIEHNRHSEGERIEEKILHTGQHYDRNMSEIFFNRLGIPQPTWKLHCGGIGSHAKMTAQMLVEIEKLAIRQNKRFLRLDCAADNDFLNKYYASMGFALSGHCTEGVYIGNRREKTLQRNSL